MTSGGKYNTFRMKNKPIWKKECSLFSPSLLFLRGTHMFFVQLFSFPPSHCLFPPYRCAPQRVCCCRIPRSSYKSHPCHSPGLCWSHKWLWFRSLVTRCPVWLGQRSAPPFPCWSLWFVCWAGTVLSTALHSRGTTGKTAFFYTWEIK